MTPALASLFKDISRQWEPPPKWTVSQWADAKRILSSEASAEPGRWKTSRSEFQRGIMDALSDPLIEKVVCMKSSQIGWTEILNNTIGYYIDYDPCPMLMLQPTEDMAEAWSEDRFSPMVRDTPAISAKIQNKVRSTKSKKLHKMFRGGHLAIVGVNAPSKLASRPIRVVLADEVDRYPASSGKEGDPLLLAERRTETFWNRKILLGGTPVWKDQSRTEQEFQLSDQRYYYIPCPHCGEAHTLQWSNVRWGPDSPAKGDTKKALWICPHCDGYYTDAQKNAAVRHGNWKAHAPFRGTAGFHIWAGYSPWRPIADRVKAFLEAKKDPEQMKVFVNTILGETWDGGGEDITVEDLMNRPRFEQETHDVPRQGLILTAGVDVQPDRLEIEVVAWGAGEQSWSIDYHIIYGDPDTPEEQAGSPWSELTGYLRKLWRHELGVEIGITRTCIDSGGHNTQAVYGYAKRHKFSGVFAIKGRGGAGLPVIGAPNRRRSGKVKRPVDVFIVGVDNAKMTLRNRLKLDSPGAGYCHFPASREAEWFRQLVAEKLMTRYVKGFAVREWQKSNGVRNEALDCRVYAFAALVMQPPQFEKLALKLKRNSQTMQTEKPKPQSEPTLKTEEPQPTAQDQVKSSQDTHPKKSKPPRSRGTFLNRWRN